MEIGPDSITVGLPLVVNVSIKATTKYTKAILCSHNNTLHTNKIKKIKNKSVKISGKKNILWREFKFSLYFRDITLKKKKKNLWYLVSHVNRSIKFTDKFCFAFYTSMKYHKCLLHCSCKKDIKKLFNHEKDRENKEETWRIPHQRIFFMSTP